MDIKNHVEKLSLNDAKKLIINDVNHCLNIEVDGIKFVGYDKDEQTISVDFNGVRYLISYYQDEIGDFYLTHCNGYCEGTSDLTVDYPDNDDYISDDILNLFLIWLKG